MAEVESRARDAYLQRRADIDTTLPYQNVKAAVLMFGEKKKSSDDTAKLTKSYEVRPYINTYMSCASAGNYIYISLSTYLHAYICMYCVHVLVNYIYMCMF
jgi:uncharacterized membrane protein